MRGLLKAFRWSIVASVAALGAAYAYGGLRAFLLVSVLIALEGSISFDNAVVNASVLRRMAEKWQRVFLTVGILIAVVLMRVIFPIAVVALATQLTLLEVVDQALTNKDAYAENAERATPVIGAFGGTFLMMVALDFLVDSEREAHWLGPLDRALAAAGQLPGLPVAVAATAVLAVSQLGEPQHERDVLISGVVAVIVFIVVRGSSDLLARVHGGDSARELSGGAGLASFLYLEMLDASFSLDGVLGAFAISKDIVIIALGLGAGAIYVRSLTVYLVRRETLEQYAYLRHGAHWAIAALAVILFVSIEQHVPEWLTATVGLGFVGSSFVSSIVHNRGRA